MSIYSDAKGVVDTWDSADKCECEACAAGGDPKYIAMAREVVRLTDALRRVAALGDPGSVEHGKAFTEGIGGWRVAERMREVALEAIGNERSDG